MQKILSNILRPSFKTLFLFICLVSSQIVKAQEIYINVIIDDQQYTFADKSIFQIMKTDMEEFVNNRRWTEDNYEEGERINLNLVLTIQKNSSQTNFYCNAQIQSTRPVFNAAYETVVFNFVDPNFSFGYTRGMSLEYNDNAYTTEITTLLAFYTYIGLAMDYDSFSLNGGKKYYTLANQAMNNNPNTSSGGWSNSSSDPNTRYWLIENAINPQYVAFSQSLYNYHRLGLDVISEKQVEAQSHILEALETIKKIKDVNLTSTLISSFMYGKRTELVAIFKGADDATKEKAIKVLRFLDPANSEKYMTIKD